MRFNLICESDMRRISKMNNFDIIFSFFLLINFLYDFCFNYLEYVQRIK